MASNSTQAGTAEILRAHDRDRWLAASLAPPSRRATLIALYAFHAEVAKTRDLVTDPVMGQIRLQWWREAVEGATQGAPRRHPVAEALVGAISSGALTAERLTGLIDAREADLTHEGFATEGDFLAYLDATAGVLNRTALEALGATDGSAREASEHVARAYGIAGQMRAAAVNAARGRVLLPLDLLASHGVTVQSMRAGRPEPGLEGVGRALADRARAELAAARALRRDVERTALPVLVLARFAERYLYRIAAAQYDLFSGRLEPVPIAGPLHVLRAMATGRY